MTTKIKRERINLKQNQILFNKRIYIGNLISRPVCFHCETLYWYCATVDRIKRASYLHRHPTGKLYLCEEHSNEANEIFQLGIKI